MQFSLLSSAVSAAAGQTGVHEDGPSRALPARPFDRLVREDLVVAAERHVAHWLEVFGVTQLSTSGLSLNIPFRKPFL